MEMAFLWIPVKLLWEAEQLHEKIKTILEI